MFIKQLYMKILLNFQMTNDQMTNDSNDHQMMLIICHLSFESFAK